VLDTKLKLGMLDILSQGVGIQGTNLYIFSEKQYMMYGKDIFLRNTLSAIETISDKHNRKALLYNHYLKEL
jgi:hypothetical protein